MLIAQYMDEILGIANIHSNKDGIDSTEEIRLRKKKNARLSDTNFYVKKSILSIDSIYRINKNYKRNVAKGDSIIRRANLEFVLLGSSSMFCLLRPMVAGYLHDLDREQTRTK